MKVMKALCNVDSLQMYTSCSNKPTTTERNTILRTIFSLSFQVKDVPCSRVLASFCARFPCVQSSVMIHGGILLKPRYLTMFVWSRDVMIFTSFSIFSTISFEAAVMPSKLFSCMVSCSKNILRATSLPRYTPR